MHLLISVEQNRDVATGASWGQGEGSTSRRVITAQLYREKCDKWAGCQVWNTRPRHMKDVNKLFLTASAPSPFLPSCCPPLCLFVVSPLLSSSLPITTNQLKSLHIHAIGRDQSKCSSVTYHSLLDTVYLRYGVNIRLSTWGRAVLYYVTFCTWRTHRTVFSSSPFLC